MSKVLSYLVYGLIRFLRLTCRTNASGDIRAQLKEQGQVYIYAVLHSQQVCSVVYAEPGSGALVSRSKDGDLLADTLAKSGAVPIRGSGGASRKGGAVALRALMNHVEGGRPAFLAVDGPKGPRGVIHAGAAMLSMKTGEPILPLALIPRKRLVFSKTWDRCQVPMPFSTIDAYFGDPMYAMPGESVAEFKQRIQDVLLQLQLDHDPSEAAYLPAPSGVAPSGSIKSSPGESESLLRSAG